MKPASQAWMSEHPGIAHMRLVERTPPEPGAGELLVEVAAAALNFSDLLMLDDRYQVRPPRPFVPGQEIAGTVVEAASQTGFKAGERVAGKVEWGGFARHALLRADMAIRLPADAPFDVAAALPVAYTTAAVALIECAAVRAGETVLVLAGAGGVGLAALDVGRALGARVVCAVGSSDKAALVMQRGAQLAVNYSEAGWLDGVRQFVGADGVDVVVDPVGGALATEALRCLAWKGRYLVVGFASGDLTQIPAHRLLLKRASAIGVYWNHDLDAVMLSDISARLTRWLAEGVIRPHVGARYPMEQAPQALAALQARGTTGKVVLTMTRA